MPLMEQKKDEKSTVDAIIATSFRKRRRLRMTVREPWLKYHKSSVLKGVDQACSQIIVAD